MKFSNPDGVFPAPYGDGYGIHMVCLVDSCLLCRLLSYFMTMVESLICRLVNCYFSLIMLSIFCSGCG